jgi:hypothetical protein
MDSIPKINSTVNEFSDKLLPAFQYPRDQDVTNRLVFPS